MTKDFLSMMRAIFTKGYGNWESCMERVHWKLKSQPIQELSSIGSNMEQANNILLMETFTEANTKMVDLMALVDINGSLKVHFTREILGMDWGMARENGKRDKLNIMVVIVRDWNKVTDNFTFLAVTFIKATLFKIKNKDMDKCSGLMAVSIRDNGNMVPKMAKVRSI